MKITDKIMDDSKFCQGCKNSDEEDCGGDVEIFNCDYKETKTEREVKNV